MLINDLNIKTLLSQDQYEIPVYQRNYAWGSHEIEQLIQDVVDFASRHRNNNYYIGTLVVANKGGYFETVDGQQRLTTLSILSAAIKNTWPVASTDWLSGINLKYASRERSQRTMKAAYDGNFAESDVGESIFDDNIKEAYKICIKELLKQLEDKRLELVDFVKYLYEKVLIMRVQLPEKIDLNHYFEIMNSRGEQLEKYEILKARLMDKLSDSALDEQVFDIVWEACANMEKYVQYGFSTDQRHLVFGKENWNSITVSTFDELVRRLKPTLTSSERGNQMSIDEILKTRTLNLQEEEKEESPDRFNTVINFPNFLLHVLRVQTQDSNVALDDKQLIDIFGERLKGPEPSVFVKDFIFNLLKCKFLFDQYVIKREFTANTDRWSLKQLKWYAKNAGNSGWGGYVNTFGGTDDPDGDNRRILMLLSAFHVSIPSMIYKHWISAALNYVFNAVEVNASDYAAYLEHIAKSFIFDRYLQNDGADFYPMIFENLQPIKRGEKEINWDKLRYGEIANNFVFNFTDYLIWLRDKQKDTKVSNYEFTFRSSVEHFYPQTPLSDDIKVIDEKHLHSFGNLCLITHEKNSRLSNFSAQSKKEFYAQSLAIDSPKQYLMMEPKQWGIPEITAHNDAMLSLLKANMDSDYQKNRTEPQAARWFREYRHNHPATLSRSLLGFGDYAKSESHDRYQLFHFDTARTHDVFQKFASFVDEHQPKTLQQVIDYHLNNEELKNDWRYLFVKYPIIYQYAEKGFFTWHETENSWQIELLHNEKRTKNAAEDMLLFLLRKHLEELKVHVKTWNFSHYIDINFGENGYQFAPLGAKGELYLRLWNKNGTMILCELGSNVHGNNRAVKNLAGLGWEYKDNAYVLGGKKQLTKLSGNATLDLENLMSGLKKLLKKGLGIKLS